MDGLALALTAANTHPLTTARHSVSLGKTPVNSHIEQLECLTIIYNPLAYH